MELPVYSMQFKVAGMGMLSVFPLERSRSSQCSTTG